jgi:hypothetical protein
VIAIDAVELSDRERRKRTAGWQLLFQMLHAVVQAEHPYAYLVATERRPTIKPHSC